VKELPEHFSAADQWQLARATERLQRIAPNTGAAFPLA
jgi:hypothetical protein